ncbi:PDZ domain-containing protein [Flavobacterium sp.]|uniref:PDZ domain-containing protein n=1 Tax=Flavobacterium sp. TaxID=239 RepID=UPI0035294BA3
MNIFKQICLFSFLVIYSIGFTQINWNSNKKKIAIPFEFTHNLIIVKVSINNVNLEMIVDTGAEKNILFNFPSVQNITFYSTRTVQISGLGSGDNLEAVVSSNNNFIIKDIQDTNFEVLLLLNNNINLVNKLGMPINGILGSSFFKDYLVEINYAKKKLFLYKNSASFYKRKVKKYDSIDVQFIKSKPYIKIPVDDATKKLETILLFDSGLSDGLWLFEDENIMCNQNHFEDVLGIGLGGDVKGKKSRVKKLQIANYKLNDALVSYPDSISLQNIFSNSKSIRNGSIGGEILKRFNWVLDYNKNVFYFVKNKLFSEPFNYNMSGIEVQHEGVEWIREITRTTEKSTYNTIDAKEFIYDNPDLKNTFEYKLKPVFIVYNIRENSPAHRAGIKINDKIVSINGKKAYDYSIKKITELFQSEEGKKVKIKIDRNGEEIDFEFYLEKIL